MKVSEEEKTEADLIQFEGAAKAIRSIEEGISREVIPEIEREQGNHIQTTSIEDVRANANKNLNHLDAADIRERELMEKYRIAYHDEVKIYKERMSMRETKKAMYRALLNAGDHAELINEPKPGDIAPNE